MAARTGHVIAPGASVITEGLRPTDAVRSQVAEPGAQVVRKSLGNRLASLPNREVVTLASRGRVLRRRGQHMREYLTLQQAADLLPLKVSATTLWRWCVRGVSVPGANRVVTLQFASIGRRLFTTAGWIEDFIDHLSAVKLAAYHRRSKGRESKRWKRVLDLADADVVLRRARI